MHFTKVVNRRIDVLYSQAAGMSRLTTILTAFLFLSVLVVPQGVSDDTTNDVQSTPTIVISEVLPSPNGMKNNETCSNCYNATDWNGDGEYSKFSDQFIELHNPSDRYQYLKLGFGRHC